MPDEVPVMFRSKRSSFWSSEFVSFGFYVPDNRSHGPRSHVEERMALSKTGGIYCLHKRHPRRSFSCTYGAPRAFYLPGRTFFTTEEGRMGLGPFSTAPDDGICIGLGCSNLSSIQFALPSHSGFAERHVFPGS